MLTDEVDTAYHEEVAKSLIVVHCGEISAGTVRLAKSSFTAELVSRGTDLVHQVLVKVGGLFAEPIAEKQVKSGPLTEFVSGLLAGVGTSAVRLGPMMLNIVSRPRNVVFFTPLYLFVVGLPFSVALTMLPSVLIYQILLKAGSEFIISPILNKFVVPKINKLIEE